MVKVFIVVGRLGKSLTVSKAEPFTNNKKVEKVYIFREEAGFPVKGAEYITIPNWIKNIRPKKLQRITRILFESLQLLWYTYKFKPFIINGVGVKPKGWNSVMVSLISRSYSIFSLIGDTVSITTYYKHKNFWKRINLWFLKKSNIVTSKGINMNNYLVENGIKSEKIFLFNGSIDTNKFHYKKNIKKDIDVLFVGNFSILKGPDRVLKVISELTNTAHIHKAVFLGDGVLHSTIKEAITDNGLEDLVSLMGYVSNPVNYFQRSKIIIIPSKSEGLPTVMLEAMACECVPIVSNVGNVTDAAIHWTNSFVVDDYRDIQSFTNYSRTLLADNEKRKSFARNGRKCVEESYSVDKQSQIVDDMINYLYRLESISYD